MNDLPSAGAVPRASYANFKALQWALTLTSECKSNSKSVLIRLAQHADEYGCCFPASRTLASEVAVTTRTIRRCLSDLEDRRLIRRIGRVGDHGGQTSNVVVLIGWTDRKPIPKSGHPVLGPTIQESIFQTLNLLATNRRFLPQGADIMSGQKYRKENINTTTAAQNEADEALLQTCFDALGEWATDRNRRYLTEDFFQLETLLERGADLYLDILPVLRSVSERRKIPTLRTWAYFHEMIEARLSEKTESPKVSQEPKDTSDPSFHEHKANNIRHSSSEADPNVANDPEMAAVLRKLVKRGPGQF